MDDPVLESVSSSSKEEGSEGKAYRKFVLLWRIAGVGGSVISPFYEVKNELQCIVE